MSDWRQDTPHETPPKTDPMAEEDDGALSGVRMLGSGLFGSTRAPLNVGPADADTPTEPHPTPTRWPKTTTAR
jgi:hypothetical protein